MRGKNSSMTNYVNEILGECSNTNLHMWLAMAVLLEGAALFAIADDAHRRVAAFFDDLGGYFGTLHIRLADGDFRPIIGQKHLIEGDRVT